MVDSMSPSDKSPLAEGQIAKFQELQAAALRKSGLSRTMVQVVLESCGLNLAHQFVGMVRQRVAMFEKHMTRHVRVNLTDTAREAFAKTYRGGKLNDRICQIMPRPTREEVDVIFFPVNEKLSDTELVKEYDIRGLYPVDPFTLAAVNATDHHFANTFPNATHWKDAEGTWYGVLFNLWEDERFFWVGGHGFLNRYPYPSQCWFGGVRRK